ncbi:hypothetical protein BJY01DRAFT_236794 [Aspergillus pseudoustus]|uniref:NAD(P)-binding protein n=1 Tax=Aspergillus pseudoustus TaxID=1810923 RepID=A0ABR4JJR6_9EURO
MADKDMLVKAMAFTKTGYRDIYPAIEPAQPKLSQAGKVIVITGATRGLGRGFAIAFAHAKPAAIALLGRSSDALAETERQVREISSATKILSIVVDVLDEPGVEAAFEAIVAQCGVPHVLVNNAGIALLGTIAEATIDDFWKVQEVNVKGTLIVSKAFLKSTESAPEEQRTILNMTSVSTQHTPVTLDSYTISKTAVIKFTEFLAAEYPSVTCISLDPGMVPTDMGRRFKLIEPFLFDTMELASGAAVWLSAGDKKFLSGRYVSVNWDVEELEARRHEIVEKNLLTSALKRGDKPVGELIIHP